MILNAVFWFLTFHYFHKSYPIVTASDHFEATNSGCLVQLITPPTLNQEIISSIQKTVINMKTGIPTIRTSIDYVNFQSKVVLCSETLDDYEGLENCSLRNPYTTRKFGVCHSVWISATKRADFSTVLQTFELFELAKFRFLEPVNFIVTSSAEIIQDIFSMAKSKSVILPPAKTIVISRPEWAYLCYFCNTESEILKWTKTELPSSPEISKLYDSHQILDLISAHGSKKGTFQSMHTGTEWGYNHCKMRGRGARITTPHDPCHISFMMWDHTSKCLNFSFHEGDMFESVDSYDNPLAYCENCDLHTPPDSHLDLHYSIYIGLYYCTEQLGGTPLSWKLLVRPFQPVVWAAILATGMSFAILHKSPWVGFDILFYLLTQNLQYPKWPRVCELSFIFLIVLTCGYSSILTSSITAPPPEKVIETFKELFEGEKPHKLFVQDQIRSLLKARAVEIFNLTGVELQDKYIHLSGFDNNWGFGSAKFLADNRGTFGAVWGDKSITRFAFGGYQCRFVLQKASSRSSYFVSARSYLRVPFVRILTRLHENGLIVYWKEMLDWAGLLLRVIRTAGYHENGVSQRVVDVVRERLQPRRMWLDDNVVLLFEMYLALCAVAMVGCLVEGREKLKTGFLAGVAMWKKLGKNIFKTSDFGGDVQLKATDVTVV
ncbi:hypothetical protein Fcan01_20288 [Folsomia candida]|uniref:Uncharacterized protein n=1 Tax=Folsomia candida TaxID=158441 RepID=A0A226DL93_FOLCA|nr:hypothetical protein Fcan01_20288 [Folsomia candida]